MGKYLFWVIALLPLVSGTANADDRREQAMQRVEANLQDAQERLQLSDEQAAQLRPILTKDAEQRLEVIGKYATDENGERKRPSRKDMKEMRDQIQMINERSNESLSRILSAEQMAEYREMMNERRASMREEAKKRRSEQ